MLTFLVLIPSFLILPIAIYCIFSRKTTKTQKVVFLLMAMATPLIYVEGKKSFEKQQTEKNSDCNLIQYLTDRNIKGLPDGLAITTANLNLRVNPTKSSKVIIVIPKESRVNYNLLFLSDRKGEWIKLCYNGTIGWVNAKYLRPGNQNERMLSTSEGVLTAFSLLFPEKSLIDNCLSLLLAIPFSIVLNLISIWFNWKEKMIISWRRFLISVDELTFVGPMVYLCMKNNALLSHPPIEMFIITLLIIIISFIIDWPISKTTKYLYDKLY